MPLISPVSPNENLPRDPEAGDVHFKNWFCGPQAGFYHRNSIFQRYIDVPLPALVDAGAAVPPQLRMVVSEALCAELAAADISSAASAAADISGSGDIGHAASDVSGTAGASTTGADCAGVVSASDQARPATGSTEGNDSHSADAAGSDTVENTGARAASQSELSYASCNSGSSVTCSRDAGSAEADAAGLNSSGHRSAAGLGQSQDLERSDAMGSNPLHAMLEESFRLALDTRCRH